MTGLFGGSRKKVDWGRLGTFLVGGTSGLDRRDQRAAMEQQQAETDRRREMVARHRAGLFGGAGGPSTDSNVAGLGQVNPGPAEAQAPPQQPAYDPTEAAIFDLDPEAWAENMAYMLRPRTLAPGSTERYGRNATYTAPTTARFDDRFGTYDPQTGEVAYTEARGPTFAEQTGRIQATSPVNVAPGNVLVDPESGEPIARGAGRVFSAGPGAMLFGENGNPIAENPKEHTPSAASVELQGQYDTNANEVIPTIGRMREALRSGDVITGIGADARLQAARALAAAGNRDARRVVAATEAYLNDSGRLRVGMAKTLGPNPSDADMRILEQVTAGNIGQNQDSLLSTLDQGFRFAESRQQSLGALLNSQRAPQRPSPQSQGPRRVSSRADYDALPRGSTFIAPDGSTRRKP